MRISGQLNASDAAVFEADANVGLGVPELELRQVKVDAQFSYCIPNGRSHNSFLPVTEPEVAGDAFSSFNMEKLVLLNEPSAAIYGAMAVFAEIAQERLRVRVDKGDSSSALPVLRVGEQGGGLLFLWRRSAGLRRVHEGEVLVPAASLICVGE